VPVFGLLKRGGKVYAKVVSDVKGKTLKTIMEDKIVPDSIVYSDTFVLTMCWMFPASNTTGSTMPNCLPTGKTTSTASRISEPGQAAFTQIQWGFQSPFPALFEGM